MLSILTSFLILSSSFPVFNAFPQQQVAQNDGQQCGIANEPNSHERNHEAHYPWAVALFHVYNINHPAFLCTASIIGPRHILTAAHCLYDDFGNRHSIDFIVAGAADYTNESEAKMYPVKSGTTHPDYVLNGNGAPDDVAVLTLESPLEFNDKIAPICFGPIDKKAGEEIVVTGWGQIKNCFEKECYPTKLRQGHMQIVADQNCSVDPAATPLTPKKEVCAKPGDSTIGHGDSGGPVMIKKAGKWHQIGINSYLRCHVVGTCGEIFTSVDYYHDWITEQMDSTDDNDEKWDWSSRH